MDPNQQGGQPSMPGQPMGGPMPQGGGMGGQFKCPKCDASFNSQEELDAHTQQVHGGGAPAGGMGGMGGAMPQGGGAM